VNDPKHVLVVDDEPSIRALYQMAFAHGGCAVTVAPSAEDALERLRERPVDVMFLDLNLPGMNGLELAAKITGEWPDIRIIAITGNVDTFGESAIQAAGFNALLLKPVHLQDLLEALEPA